MSIYISNSLYLSGGAGDDFNANNPIIGYHSILTPSDILVNNEQAGFNGINMWSPDTSTKWKPLKSSFAIVYAAYFDNPNNEVVNYIGIAKHNFGSLGYSVTVQYYDPSVGEDGGYVDLQTARIPRNDGSMMFYFNDNTSERFRIRMEAPNLSTDVPIISHVKMGRALVLQRRIYVGHRPATIAKKVARVTHGSENGQYLGQIVKRSFYTSEISQENNSPAFVREYIVPFINHINGDVVIEDTAPATFFFAWRPSDYPDEVVYGWTMDQISPENQGGDTLGGRMSWNCSIEAVA